MHQVSWAVSAGSQAVAQASDCEEVRAGPGQPANKLWEGGQGWWEAVCPHPGQGLGAPLILSSSTELRALPARMCWGTRRVPGAGGEDAESDLRSGSPMLPNPFDFPSPHPHPQTKHLTIRNK